MKNFSMKHKDSKTFILHYRVEDNQILISLASKEKYIIPYTLENEKTAVNRMRQQVLNVDAFENKQKKKFSDAIVNLVVALFIISVGIYVLVVGDKEICWPIVGIAIGAIMLLSTIYAMKRSKAKLRDIYKNKLFIANEKTLNDHVKTNSNILYHTSAHTKEMVSSMLLKHQPAFTFNTIDKMKYKELKQILNNIERAEELGFTYVIEKKETEKEFVPKKKVSKKKQ